MKKKKKEIAQKFLDQAKEINSTLRGYDVDNKPDIKPDMSLRTYDAHIETSISPDGMLGSLFFPLPDFQTDFKDAQNAFNYKRVIGELYNELRNCYKHGSGADAKHAAKWRDRLIDILGEYDLDLGDL